MTRKNIFALSCRLRDTTSTRILHSTSHFAEIGDRDNKKDGMLPSLQKKVRVLRNRCNRLTRPFLKNNEATRARVFLNHSVFPLDQRENSNDGFERCLIEIDFLIIYAPGVVVIYV